jgi:hypothetical protein
LTNSIKVSAQTAYGLATAIAGLFTAIIHYIEQKIMKK